MIGDEKVFKKPVKKASKVVKKVKKNSSVKKANSGT